MADIIVRKLARADLDTGFLESLDSLRSTSDLLAAKTREIFDTITSNPNHNVFVAERDGRIVGTATLLVEHKFIHNGGLVGHIEDVAVHRDAQRTRVGSQLVCELITEARREGCYKVILDCSKDLVPYYENLGFSPHSVTMRKNLD